MKLTKRAIDGFEYQGGTDYRWDDVVRGFGVRVYPSGKKSFVISYWFQGRKRFVVLGPYGVLTLDEARLRARKLLSRLLEGKDPRERAGSGSKSPDVAALFEHYFSRYAEVRKKPRSVKEDRGLADRHILPKLGKRRVAEVTRDEVLALQHGLRATKVTANRTLALLSKAFSLAEEWGWRAPNTNPVRGIKKFAEKPRERFLTPAELARLAEALDAAANGGSESPHAVAAIRLLLLTGCRMSEILTLKWSAVDLEGGFLKLSDTKTGARVVHLSSPARDLLATLPRESSNDFVIVGGVTGSHLVDLERPWRRIRALAQLPDVRLHDLRHTFASVGAGLGLSLPQIGKLLGHTQAATTQRYAHLADDPLREATEAIGRFLTERTSP